MRSKQARQAKAKTTASKTLIPLREDVQLQAINCPAGHNTVACRNGERIFAYCNACRWAAEIAVAGLTTVKKVA